MLQGKSAVVFGAGGSIGSAVAKEFAAEGAEVFLAGRTRSNLDPVERDGPAPIWTLWPRKSPKRAARHTPL